MTTEVTLATLNLAALTIGLTHTLVGPDHYVPFVAMARVGNWTIRKTLVVTLLCGLAHVGSSIVLGMFGVALGTIVGKLNDIEGVRGDLASWLLIAFGSLYLLWGVVRAIRNKPHTHLHIHADGTFHVHEHSHARPLEAHHDHAHSTAAQLTPWVLFTIFIFGPCEPLIPLLMVPAAETSLVGVVSVSAIFCLATLAVMLTMVSLLYLGTGVVQLRKFERYSHAFAGLVVLTCGMAIKFGL